MIKKNVSSLLFWILLWAKFLYFIMVYVCAQKEPILKQSCGLAAGIKVLVTQQCPTLCNPMDCSPPGSFVHGLLQARILEWTVIPIIYLLSIEAADLQWWNLAVVTKITCCKSDSIHYLAFYSKSLSILALKIFFKL